MSQLDWLQAQRDFIDTPRARRSDPLPSQVAAEKIKAVLGKQQRIVLEVVRAHPGCTAGELARFCSLDRVQLGKRLPELEGVYLFRGPPRICAVARNLQTTWTALREG